MESSGFFKAVTEQSGAKIMVASREGSITFLSRAFKDFFKNRSLMLPVRIQELLSPEDIRRISSHHLESYNPFIGEVTVEIEGEQFFFDLESSAPGAEGYLLTFHDVTARKNREQELERSNLQLDQVIYKTTHDLKAPLMSSLGLVNLASKSTADEYPRYIELIRKSLVKMNSFIEEMNVFFRNEKLALQRERIDLRAMIDEEIKNMENLPGSERVQVKYHVDGDHEFYSDPVRVKTVITNLLSNALKYSDTTKTISFVNISFFINQEFCEIRIVDNGIGIEPELKGRIFDLFFRATTQSHGTGLGLFIVKDTIHKLGGTIEVESVLNQGTAFRLQIPNQIQQPIEVA